MSVKKKVKMYGKRIRMSGIPAKTVIEGDRGYIIIKISDIVNLIDRKIDYPKHKIHVENNMIIVEVWK